MPLADRLRPTSIDNVAGQLHLLQPGSLLRSIIDNKTPVSFILWGPPGTGKTTIARIYAHSLEAELFELSAVSAGKADIRKIVELESDKQKVLFLDEIHRFNKAQQDYLLPFVESGELLLIGATTENPSFEINNALMSRMTLFVLKELSTDDLAALVLKNFPESDPKASIVLANMANGDARRLYTLIESVLAGSGEITLKAIESAGAELLLRYDQSSEEHYDVVSAFIKSMRASQADGAIYYLARMLEGGEDPVFIARRMVIFASEDIGNLQPTALVVANAVFDAVRSIGMPEARINLAQGVVYLSRAPKGKESYNAINSAIKLVKETGNLAIPLKLRNAPTKMMKGLGYGKGYEKYSDKDYLPDKIKGKKFL